MKLMYCIDASVVTNSQMEKEKFHASSKKFMDVIIEANVPIIVPEIIIPEISSAIARGTDNAQYAIKFVREFRRILNMNIVPLESRLSNLAADIAAKYKLRGADSIYVAISVAFNLRLITLDKHQKENAPKGLDVFTPEEELKRLKTE